MNKELKEMVEKGIDNLIENGLQVENLDSLSKLVDIHKDLENEEYWKEKKEVMEMKYRGYGNEYGNDYSRESYGRRMRDSRGRFRESGNMGRRYRGEETMDEMYGAYREYSEGREQMNMGNYSAKGNTMKSLEYMLQSVVEFIEMLKKDANSQEEVELIQEYTRHISEM
jgi:hypothetical protein